MYGSPLRTGSRLRMKGTCCMIQADLITGFLGSGKTTFLKKYVRGLLDRGIRTGVLVNDYGAVNVDMLLLQDLLKDERCEVEMVLGGDYDCHRRRFKTKLIALAMSGCERVVIEPSGVYDVDEFFDVLHEEPLDRWYVPGSVIAVVDAALPEKLSRESEYLLVSQTADAGTVLLSRTQEASEEEMEATRNHLNRSMETFGCGRRFGSDLWTLPWDELTEEDLERIASGGHRSEPHVKLPVERNNAYSSRYYMNMKIPLPQLAETAEAILKDPGCGNVIRIKGFMETRDGWHEINAGKDTLELRPVEKGQAVIIVIGENLNPDKIDEQMKKAAVPA